MLRPGVTTARDRRGGRSVLRRTQAVPLFKGVPGTVPFPASHLHLDQRGSGSRHSRLAKTGGRRHRQHRHRLQTQRLVRRRRGDLPVGRIDPEVRRLLDVTRNVLEPGHRADGPMLALEPGGRRDGSLREEAPVSRWSRRSSATASAATCTKTRRCRISSAANSAAARRFPPRAGIGDRRGTDGQHGHQAGPHAGRPLDPGHGRRPAERPFRAYGGDHGKRAVGADGRPERRNVVE